MTELNPYESPREISSKSRRWLAWSLLAAGSLLAAAVAVIAAVVIWFMASANPWTRTIGVTLEGCCGAALLVITYECIRRARLEPEPVTFDAGDD